MKRIPSICQFDCRHFGSVYNESVAIGELHSVFGFRRKSMCVIPSEEFSSVLGLFINKSTDISSEDNKRKRVYRIYQARLLFC